jgi:hypothetical protein
LDAGPGRLLGENGWISKCKSFIHSLEVVNDCAERGVKLITDFKDVTKDVQQQQYLFQVIEAHHSRFKSYNKSHLQNI